MNQVTAKVGEVVIQWYEALPNLEWHDGDSIVVAVPLSSGGIYYSVITIACDEDYFEIRCNGGDAWGWCWDDVEAWTVLPGMECLGAKKNKTICKPVNIHGEGGAHGE